VRKWLAYGIVGFWLVMAVFFLRREVFPYLYAQPVRGYASLRDYAALHPIHRMRIETEDGLVLGETQTTYQLMENGDCEIASTTVIDLAKRLPLLAAFGVEGPLDITATLTVDRDDSLKSLRAGFRTLGYSGSVQGVPAGDRLRMVVLLGGQRTEMSVPFDPDDLVAAGFAPLAGMRHLKVGQMWQFKVLDPFRHFEFATAIARVERKTKISLGDPARSYPAYEIKMSHGTGASPWQAVTVWVSESGHVLKEKAGGLVFICDPLPAELAAAGEVASE